MPSGRLPVKNRFSEAQVTAVLMDALSVESAEELSARHGLPSAVVAGWLGVIQSLTASESLRQAAVLAENARLKKLLAEALFEVEIARKILRKNGVAQAAAEWSAPPSDVFSASQPGRANMRTQPAGDAFMAASRASYR